MIDLKNEPDNPRRVIVPDSAADLRRITGHLVEPDDTEPGEHSRQLQAERQTIYDSMDSEAYQEAIRLGAIKPL